MPKSESQITWEMLTEEQRESVDKLFRTIGE
jgi:hypothetical protein